VVKGSIVSSAARQVRIGRFEGSGSFSGLARVAGLTLKQPTVYFLAPLPQWIFSGRELITWSIMMELSVYGTWSGLPNEIASELFSSATLYQLKAGDTLFQTGDKGDGCYRLDVGLLKVSLISPQVKERIIAIITPGVVVGDLAVIDGLPRSASVHALTDCELRFLSRAAFERLAQDHPEIHQYLVKLLAARLRQADEIIASLAFLPAKAGVAYALLALAENLGEETDSGAVLIPRIINQGDIAAMAGSPARMQAGS
jgi:CRP/FNR family transcriptional regulator